MPIIGYHWLRFLAETDLNLNDGFNAARSQKELEFSRAGFTTNPGRLATIYTVLMATWKLLCESPLGEVFKEATEDFTRSLTRAIQEQGSIVNSDTEVSKFLAGVNELLASQPGLFQSRDGKTLLGRVVGKHTEEGLFLLPNEILAELDKLKVFTQKPTVDSIGKALADAGKLVIDKDTKHRQIARRVNGKLVRGWLLLPDALNVVTSPMVTENQRHEPPVTTVTSVTTEKGQKIFSENLEDQREGSDSKKESKESGGSSGNNGNSNDIDSGFSVTKPLPSKEEVVSSSLPLDGIKADFPAKYLCEVLVCQRIKVAIASGIMDPFKLAEASGIPVCIAAKRTGVNSITAAVVIGQLEEHRRDQYFGEQADRLMTRPKEGAKKIHSYAEMASWVPPDNSSPEAAKIIRAFCILLMRGDAPRVDLLAEKTGLPEVTVQAYLDDAHWIRKDDSSPAGIVVYLPMEASA